MSSFFTTACIKNIILVCVFIFIGTTVYYASNDANAMTTKTYTYGLSILLPLLFAFIYIQSTTPVGSPKFSMYAFGAMFGVVFFLGFLFYLYQSLNSSSMYLINLLLNGIAFFILLVILAIFFKIFENTLVKMEGIPGFLVHFIFYLPCLLTIFIEFLQDQYKITPNIVYILFLIEILLFLAYLYIPRMIRTVVNKNGLLLQNEPIFTEIQPVQIAYSDMLSSSKYTPDTLFQDKTKEKSFLKNYSLSLWVFINNQSASSSASYTKETSLFKYGYIDTTTTVGTTTHCFKPQITYDQSENSYFVYMTNYTEDTKETVRYRLSTMPSQRWNHFVFNYNNNTADLFINGNLERTFSFPDNVPIYSSSDIMTIGDTNGIQGAICNVSYHDVVLTGSEIKKMHAIYSVSNPPIQPLRNL